MRQRHHCVSFPPVLAIVSVALLSGCGVTAAHRQQAPGAPTTPTCSSVAASWAYMDTLAQLKQKAQVIVVGTVVSTQVGQDGPCELHTDATVRVDRTVSDPSHHVTGASLVVRTQGGQLPSGYGEEVEDEARLGVGDQFVLFLTPDTATGYRVVDGNQGATPIIDGLARTLSSGALPLGAYLAQIEQT